MDAWRFPGVVVLLVWFILMVSVPSLPSGSAVKFVSPPSKLVLLLPVGLLRLDRVKKQMTVSGNMSQEMDRGESRNNWRQVKNESDKYLDHNSKRESGNAET